MGVYGTDSSLTVPRRKMFLVGFAVREMVMVIFSGSAPFLPFNMFRELPEFATLVSLDRRKWSRCLHELVHRLRAAYDKSSVDDFWYAWSTYWC